MRAIRNTSIMMVMISLLIIIAHSVVPHHHNDSKIWVCGSIQHSEHQHVLSNNYHSDFKAINSDIYSGSFMTELENQHVCGNSCVILSDNCSCQCNSICDIILSFVHSSIQEIPEHILFLATLPVNYLAYSDDDLIYNSYLSHDLSYLNDKPMSHDYLILDRSTIRRGPPSISYFVGA